MGPCQDNTPNEYRTRNIQYSQLCTQASETPPRARQQRVTKEGLLVSYFSTRKKVTRRFLFPIAQHHLFFCTIWIFVSRTTQSVSTTVHIKDSRLRVINPSLVLTALVMFWKEWEQFFTSRERFEIGLFKIQANDESWYSNIMALFTDTLLLLLKFQNLIWNFTKTCTFTIFRCFFRTNCTGLILVAKYTGLQRHCAKKTPRGV